MKILQISGSGRNCGKTTLGCALIHGFPTLRWSALKLTPHQHAAPSSADAGMRSRNAVTGRQSKDTDRFLAAGVVSAQLRQAVPDAQQFAAKAAIADVLLIESGQPLDCDSWPLLHLAIAPLHTPALWKTEFLLRLAASGDHAVPLDAQPSCGRINALILLGDPQAEIPSCVPAHLPIFRLRSPIPLTPSLESFVVKFLAKQS